MVNKKGSIIFLIGFIFLGVWVYLARFQKIFADGLSLTGYLVGCLILLIGLFINKKG